MFGPMLNTDPVQNTTRKKVGGDNGPGGGPEMREREREREKNDPRSHAQGPTATLYSFRFLLLFRAFRCGFFCLFVFVLRNSSGFVLRFTRAGGGGTESGEAEKGAALRRDVIGGWGSSLTSRRGPDQSAVGWRRGLRARPHARSRTRTRTHTHTHTHTCRQEERRGQ